MVKLKSTNQNYLNGVTKLYNFESVICIYFWTDYAVGLLFMTSYMKYNVNSLCDLLKVGCNL